MKVMDGCSAQGRRGWDLKIGLRSRCHMRCKFTYFEATVSD